MQSCHKGFAQHSLLWAQSRHAAARRADRGPGWLSAHPRVTGDSPKQALRFCISGGKCEFAVPARRLGRNAKAAIQPAKSCYTMLYRRMTTPPDGAQCPEVRGVREFKSAWLGGQVCYVLITASLRRTVVRQTRNSRGPQHYSNANPYH